MAVRLDSTDRLTRTANLPLNTAFTLMAWSHRIGNTGTPTLFSLEASGQSNGNYLYHDPGGSGLAVYQGGAPVYFASSPSNNVPICYALVGNGTGPNTLLGYWRAPTDTAWTTQMMGNASFTVAQLTIGNDLSASSSFEWDGRIWNVTLWGRALTAAELWVESFFERPHYPSSLNLWWPLYSASDTADRSGNARNPTVTGTLTTEDRTFNLWRPRPKQLIRIPAAGGGALRKIVGTRFSLAGIGGGLAG